VKPRTDELLAVDDFDVGSIGLGDGLVHSHVVLPALLEVDNGLFRIHIAVVGGGQLDLANVLLQELIIS
jgi:hypothetical protein